MTTPGNEQLLELHVTWETEHGPRAYRIVTPEDLPALMAEVRADAHMGQARIVVFDAIKAPLAAVENLLPNQAA